jgi:hypothetical protein
MAQGYLRKARPSQFVCKFFIRVVIHALTVLIRVLRIDEVKVSEPVIRDVSGVVGLNGPSWVFFDQYISFLGLIVD